jgi:hypothetical protein
MLSWVAILIGLLMVIGGIGHTSGVISVAIKEGRPYNESSVFLLTTGGILLYSGLLNIAISRWIKQARAWALAMSSVVRLHPDLLHARGNGGVRSQFGALLRRRAPPNLEHFA